MATPYLQHRIGSTRSTQDLARELLTDLPILVVAAEQTAGRGRSGAVWETAPRALAVTLAFRAGNDQRPFSLMAGVAGRRAIEGLELKWPNDLIDRGTKVGGILVERSAPVVVVGLGVNLWWPNRPEGYGALFDEDPGEEHYLEVGALWGAEMMRLVDDEGWPYEEYVESCQTIGRDITWEPEGSGRAIGVAEDGGLIVETAAGTTTLHSGAVRHVR